ncbi:hypothetical protein FSP39_008505 [Pinctada imbricata]|uniref:Uncharacterized protein n=1 Tax=Pinctada imbricata TaxID=66713 RepID=A0AA88YT80_PINIB|nr:hypothetical protein FSP39_008505 [Pinctada imbricata]
MGSTFARDLYENSTTLGDTLRFVHDIFSTNEDFGTRRYELSTSFVRVYTRSHMIPVPEYATNVRTDRQTKLLPPPRPLHSTYESVLEKHWQQFPSSTWRTENQFRYSVPVVDFTQDQVERPPFVVTTLDPRKHNPQSKQIFHIRRINNKPVCKVHTWMNESNEMSGEKGTSIYMTSFQRQCPKEPRTVVTSKDKDKLAEGIVPFDQNEATCNVREEMLLPVCETTRIPSAPTPHKYLLRKKKIPPTVGPSGVFYDEKTGDSIHTAPVYESLPRLPHHERRLHRESTSSEKTCISSLLGQEFSRKRYIPPPQGSFTVGEFDGGAPAIQSSRFEERYLPFVRMKTII